MNHLDDAKLTTISSSSAAKRKSCSVDAKLFLCCCLGFGQFLGNGRKVPAVGQGMVDITMKTVSGSNVATLQNVLFIPDLECSLLSVKAASRIGKEFHFAGDQCNIYNAKKQLVGQGTIGANGLYKLEVGSEEVVAPAAETTSFAR